jgi:hypothetical protein
MRDFKIAIGRNAANGITEKSGLNTPPQFFHATALGVKGLTFTRRMQTLTEPT